MKDTDLTIKLLVNYHKHLFYTRQKIQGPLHEEDIKNSIEGFLERIISYGGYK